MPDATHQKTMLSGATRILADDAAAGLPKCVNSFCRDDSGATEVEFIPSIDRALMQKDHALCRVLGLCRPLLCVAALLALAMPTLAQDTRREFAPEGNAYFKVSDQARVYLQASVVGRPTQNTTDGELGANFDYTFKPIFRPELLNAQWERDRYLWARVGYLLGGGEEGLKDFHERRIIVQATGRILLANQFWLMHRGQVDFRDIDGQAVAHRALLRAAGRQAAHARRGGPAGLGPQVLPLIRFRRGVCTRSPGPTTRGAKDPCDESERDAVAHGRNAGWRKSDR